MTSPPPAPTVYPSPNFNCYSHRSVWFFLPPQPFSLLLVLEFEVDAEILMVF